MNAVSQWLDWDCPDDPEECGHCGRRSCSCVDSQALDCETLEVLQELALECFSPEAILATLTPDELRKLRY